METYRMKEVESILKVSGDTVHRYMKLAIPDELKPTKTFYHKTGQDAYEFTAENIKTFRKSFKLKKTGLTYKQVKELLIANNINNQEEVGDEIIEMESNEEGEEIMGMDLTVINQSGKLLVDSRDVAEMVDKKHPHLLRDIRNYEGHFLTNPVLDSLDFFLPSEYQDAKGEKRENYLITKKGCEFIANKLTGIKGTQFTAIYINTFNKMEKSLQQVYHVSETAIVNNVMGAIEDRIFTGIDERLAKYEENYRPTHANKISINTYIKKGLGELQEDGEVDLVKERVLFLLNAEAWQDIPYERFVKSIKQVDESIRAVKSFRTRSQLSLFEEAN